MGKLYSDKDSTPALEIGTVVRWDGEEPVPVDLSPLEDVDEALGFVQESFSETTHRLEDVASIGSVLSTRKLASVEYFLSVENYTPILHRIASGLGVKLHVASMEDFQNTHSTEASHSVAMEGIAEFIKTIWKKLKDLMFTFFKKVREFFRRLVNANMELDTYEKYLPGMISRIKSEKLKVTDNTPSISSKLPSLLAQEGMGSVDSDYVITEGQRALESLIVAIRDKAKLGLKTIGSIELVKFRETLTKIVELDYSKFDILDRLREQTMALQEAVIGIAGAVTPIPYSAKDLPDDAFESLSASVPDGLSAVRIMALVDHKDPHECLPKNFNVFTVFDTENRLYANTTSYLTEGVDEHLNPVENIQNLSRLYDFYKKFSKQVNIRELDAVIGDCERGIEDTIKLMQSRFSTVVEHVKQAKNGYLLKPDSYGIAVNYFYEHMHEDPMAEVRRAFRNDPAIFEMLGTRTMPRDVIHLLTTRNAIAKFMDEMDKATKDPDMNTNDEFRAAMGLTTASAKDIATLIEVLDNLNKFVLGFFKALQVMFRGLSGNLIATYTECRYELAKYLYQSARRYG